MALHEAAKAGDVAEVKRLLAASAGAAEVNARDNTGWTPLHKASTNGHAEAVAALLAAGAEVGAHTNFDMTSLHWASMNGHSEVVTKLLAAAHGATEVDARDNNDTTPLHYASMCGHPEVVSRLLAAGAEVDSRSCTGMTPLHHASTGGRSRVVAALLDAPHGAAKVDPRTNDGMTPLHFASRYGHAEVVAALLAAGAEVDPRSCTGSTPFHFASRFGHAEVVATLLTAGAEVDSSTNAGLTPLHWASREGHAEIIKLLILAGANRVAKDTFGRTPADRTGSGPRTLQSPRESSVTAVRLFLNPPSPLYRVQAMADIIGWIAFSAYVLCAVIMTGVVIIVVGGVSWALWSDFRDFVGSIIDDGKLLEFGGIALLAAFAMWAAFALVLVVEILKNSGAPARKISISRAVRWMGVCLAAVPLWPAAAVFVAQLWSSADFTALVVAAGTVIQFAVLVVVAVYALVPFLPPDGGGADGLAAPGNNEPVANGSVAIAVNLPAPATRVELEDLVAVNTGLDILEPV